VRVDRGVRAAPQDREAGAGRARGPADAQRLAERLARARAHEEEQRVLRELDDARLRRELEAAVHDHHVPALEPRAEREEPERHPRPRVPRLVQDDGLPGALRRRQS
jgi:hypothetical protein